MASLPVGMHSRASNAGLQMHQMSFQTHSVDGPVVCVITLWFWSVTVTRGWIFGERENEGERYRIRNVCLLEPLLHYIMHRREGTCSCGECPS